MDGAAELFATALDVYVFLEETAEDEADTDTADGRPATRGAAHARLSRMLCADSETCTHEEVRQLALLVRQRQVGNICAALAAVCEASSGRPPAVVLLAGSGEFLGREVVARVPALQGARIVSLARELGSDISKAACAYGLAVLASECQRGESDHG
jgi:hypothetical protein